MSLDTITNFLNQLGDLTPAAFCCVILVGLNLLMRRTPIIPNWAILWISVVAGMIIFPIFLPITTSFKNPIGRNIGMGFIIGLIAGVGYHAIVAFAEKKWPWLHDVLNPGGPPPPDSDVKVPAAPPDTDSKQNL